MLRLVPPLLALLASDPPTAVRVGEHFKVVCHFEAGPLAVQALEAAEAVWPVAVEVFDVDARPPDEPLELHLYRDPAEYRAAEERITGGYFRRNLAFAHHKTRTAHVAVQPALEGALLLRVGLPEQTLRLIAHEAAHLVRFDACANHAYHPNWYIDGAASWIDQQAMQALGKSESIASDPWTSQELRSLQGLLEGGRLPSARAILRDELRDVSFYDRYSVRHGFFRFLREGDERSRLARIQREIQRTAGGGRYLSTVDGAVDRLYGARGYERLDARFKAWIREQKPEWDVVRRSLAIRADDWLQLAFGDEDALAWRTELPQRARYTLAGQLELLPAPVREAHLVFARGPAAWLRVVVGEDGTLRLERVEEASGEVVRLAEYAPEAAASPRTFALELRVDGAHVALRLDGDERLALDVQDAGVDLSGPWGVGTRAGSASRWRGLALD